VGCVNTLGSYQCVDLRDQVSGDHHLSTEPTNTGSSISADCSSGFKVGPSGSCIDVDECATNNGDCSHICQNTLGGANCLCPPGFMLGNDWKTCKGTQFFCN
jgi:fibulin 1/2